MTHRTFDGTTSGIRIKTSREKGGPIENLIYRDLTMTNVEIPVNLVCYYPKIPTADPSRPVTGTTPIYRNIQIINLTASGPKSAGFVVGLPEMCISNVVFDNVKLSAITGLTHPQRPRDHLQELEDYGQQRRTNPLGKWGG